MEAAIAWAAASAWGHRPPRSSPGNSTRPATFRSVWKDARLVTTIVTRTEQGADVTFEEIRYLDPKGNLVVEISTAGQPNARRTVYSKGKSP